MCYKCHHHHQADVIITHNLTQAPSNTLVTRYERILNFLKITLKWKKHTSKELKVKQVFISISVAQLCKAWGIFRRFMIAMV